MSSSKTPRPAVPCDWPFTGATADRRAAAATESSRLSGWISDQGALTAVSGCICPPCVLQLPGEYGAGSTGMVEQDLSDRSEPLGTGPIALQFSGQGEPGDRLGTRSDHPADGHVMG